MLSRTSYGWRLDPEGPDALLQQLVALGSYLTSPCLVLRGDKDMTYLMNCCKSYMNYKGCNWDKVNEMKMHSQFNVGWKKQGGVWSHFLKIPRTCIYMCVCVHMYVYIYVYVCYIYTYITKNADFFLLAFLYSKFSIIKSCIIFVLRNIHL